MPSQISIHALLAESDRNARPETRQRDAISIHALLAESDVEKVPADVYYQAFLSTLSLRRATAVQIVIVVMHALFLSTLSLRRATMQIVIIVVDTVISIHALLAESDINEVPYQRKIDQFLSTLSLRRATTDGLFFFGRRNNFYPRSPCGERRYWPCVFVVGRAISIHALLAESDMSKRLI